VAEGKGKLELSQITFLNARNRENWAAIETQCKKVVELLRQLPDGRGKTGTLECSPPQDTRALADNLFALEQRRKVFKSECSDADLPKLSFSENIALGRKCLRIAELEEKDVAALGPQLSRVSEEQNKDAHTFARTISAFQRGDTLAYIAAVIAFSLDGLIFLCGFWGARANISHLTRRGAVTPAEIDDHANMMMMMETRPEELRPAGGWPVPAEVYKARVFMRNVKPYDNADRPEFAGTISRNGLSELERETVKSVLMIGPFVQLFDKSDTWLVTSHLIRYLTSIAASYDRLQRLHGASDAPVATPVYAARPERVEKPESEIPSSSYWAGAAAAVNGTLPDSEDEFIDAGFKAHMAQSASAVEGANDNPLSPSDPDPDPQVRENESSRSAAG
jgi:hypothetical protein